MVTETDPLSEYVECAPLPIARHVVVIAEIGINHNGDVEIAKQLIKMAAVAGCDLVKFQKRTVDVVYSKEFLDSPRASPWGNTQRDQKCGLEFERREYDEIDAYCRALGIDWFASAWDVPSQLFLRRYDLEYNKIASAMVTHPELPALVADEKKLTFISTGMSTYEEIDRIVRLFRNRACPFVLMHTVSEYPVREEALNLMCICELRKRYNCSVGYSGHETTMFPGAVAAALGAVAVERHITLDRAMYGSDQAASLERRGLELLVAYLRTIPRVLGDGVRRTSAGEAENSQKLRYWVNSGL